MTGVTKIKIMNTKNMQQVPHLLLVVDPGTSLIKVMASIAGKPIDEYKAIEILPYCVDVQKSELLCPNPDFDANSLWIKIGDDYSAIGHFANVHYPARLDAKSSKDDTVVKKVCGAIALCTQLFKLPPIFNLTINLLLPPGEQGIKDYFKDDLTTALKKLSTPAGLIKPKLLGVTVLSEGMGVWSDCKLKYEPNNQKWAVIMSGFRNTSLIVTNVGLITDRKTCQTGLYALLSQISGGYDLADLVKPVATYLETGDAMLFDHLLKSKYQDRERAQLVTSIQAAKAKIVQTLADYLNDHLPSQLDLIVKCGGTFDSIGTDLDPILTLKLAPGGKLRRHKGTGLPESIRANMHSRFADVYYVWYKLHRKSQADLKAEKDLITMK
jgi:hypothetical protein